MSFRAWLSIVTFALIAVIVYLARHELVHAWQLLGRVNVWILLLLIPGQILVYYASGEMVFSYLRAKNSIENVPPLMLARLSLEMNFVNHILPSGGVSGVSYMNWRLGKYGIGSGRATMAQVVRFAMGFVAFMTLLVLAVLVVTLDGNINRWIILMSSALVSLMVATIVSGMYLFSNKKRMAGFGNWLTRTINKLVRWVTFGHKETMLRHAAIDLFLTDMHRDYVALRHDKRILLKPYLWGILFNLADVALFLIAFWALGSPINPAPILIGYGVATIAGFFVMTPGGAGAYETIMVGFLAVAGLSQDVVIAGIVLTRVILLLGTIVMGYLFYQHAIIKYGKNNGHSIPKRQ